MIFANKKHSYIIFTVEKKQKKLKHISLISSPKSPFLNGPELTVHLKPLKRNTAPTLLIPPFRSPSVISAETTHSLLHKPVTLSRTYSSGTSTQEPGKTCRVTQKPQTSPAHAPGQMRSALITATSESPHFLPEQNMMSL